MNKRIKATMLVAAVALAGLGTWKAYDYSEGNKKTLLANNLDAQAGIIDDAIEWWNRNDYDCIEIECFPWGYSMTYPSYAGEGKGSVPHEWCCAKCP